MGRVPAVEVEARGPGSELMADLLGRAIAFHLLRHHSPHRFVSDLRIARARDLLENTDKSVTDIGLAGGFVRPSHFATMFRKRVGMSPSAWRAARRW